MDPLRDSRLFARPLWPDILRAIGLGSLFLLVVVLPPWLLPWHVTRWILAAFIVVAIWFIAFIEIRMLRESRRWQAEDAARRAARDLPQR